MNERYIVAEGEDMIEIAGCRQLMKVGDQAIVAADTPQRITNNLDDELRFNVLCTPRFTKVCYVDLD